MKLLEKLQNNRNALGWLFMLPSTLLLILFLTYPLGLGTWLGFTDAKIGRDGVKNMRPAGYAGKLGYASAGAGADFIVCNMVAEAASGSKTPKEAAERAQKRAERYYKV